MKQKDSTIHLSTSELAKQAKLNANNALSSGWIGSHGPYVIQFENNLSQYLDNTLSHAVNSATSALHLGLLALGVEQGDNVLCQDFTFVATAHPIGYLKANAVFIDSEVDTWNMDPELAKEAIITLTKEGKKPKVILLVAGYGILPKLNEFIQLSEQYNIPILLDAAAALGSQYNGMKIHPDVAITVFSFNGNKILSTGGGGAIVTHNIDLLNRISKLSNQSKNTNYQQQEQIGYNYRISNLAAAIGLGQLEQIDKLVQIRRNNFAHYQQNLNHLPGISFLEEPHHHFSNRWLTCMTIDPEISHGVSASSIQQVLQSKNIEARLLWKPLHLQPVFKSSRYFGNNVGSKLFEQGLCLPSGSDLSKSNLDLIIKTIQNCF